MHRVTRKAALASATLLAAFLVAAPTASGQAARKLPAPPPPYPYIRLQIPEMFIYDELVTLSQRAPLSPELEARLAKLTTTPFISNEAYYRGVKPHRPNFQKLGRSMRVVFWNIARGGSLDDIKLLATDREAFVAEVIKERRGGQEHIPPELRTDPSDGAEVNADEARNFALLRAQIALMREADVIILNEVDWGVPRTQYREVIRELGEAFDMNWAYGVEFLEIDPKVVGTETWGEVADPVERAALEKHFTVDKAKLRALHGSAILSRYPIRSASTTPFKVKGYDWFSGEGALPLPEKIVRSLSGVFTGDKLLREMRRGGRTSVRVDLDVPELPKGKLTVVTPHLENRAEPSDRKLQMAEVLESIRDVDHPVIVAGDLNTNGSNLAPQSFARLAKSMVGVDGLAKTAIKYLTPFSLVYSALHFGVHALHTQSDPTVVNIPLLGPNPEQGLFSMVEKFRFDDGRAFDFRGDLERTSDGTYAGKLANSNQRQGKGFAATFQIGTHIGALGKYKLDWILVKSYLKDPNNLAGQYRFAPHGAWTLKVLNLSTPEPLSDHHPISTILPFAEPTVTQRVAPKPAKELATPTTLHFGAFTCGAFEDLEKEDLGLAEMRSVWGHGYRTGRMNAGQHLPVITYEMVVAHVAERKRGCTGPSDLWIDSLRRLGPISPLPADTLREADFDPSTYTCKQFVDRRDDYLGLFEAHIVWAHGYASGVANLDRRSPPITVATVTTFGKNLVKACQADGTRLWIDAVASVRWNQPLGKH